jgi:hypothetical protein
LFKKYDSKKESMNPGVNPATCWPEGKPAFTTEYTITYDMSDPKGSFKKIGHMLLDEMVSELPGLYEMPQKEAGGLGHEVTGVQHTRWQDESWPNLCVGWGPAHEVSGAHANEQ